MKDSMEFEQLLARYGPAAERFVRYRISSLSDGDDVLQEVYFTAYRNFPALRDKAAFHGWLLGIARNKCREYFRRKANTMEVPMEFFSGEPPEDCFGYGRFGAVPAGRARGTVEVLADGVRDTMEGLAEGDRRILYLYYFQELSQKEIAERLGIPAGTVKSRLYAARQRFKERYPYPPGRIREADAGKERKGADPMKQNGMPDIMPEYHITYLEKAPFPVKWEELMGWFLVPRPGEKLRWAMYDMPSRECTEQFDMEVTCPVQVHGIEGVEVVARQTVCREEKEDQWIFAAQLTDTHCRYLSCQHVENGVRKLRTFLDGDEFLDNWGFGENNCGNEINLSPKGDIVRDGNVVRCRDKKFLLDITGRYEVTIGGKPYDTVCVMDVGAYVSGVVTEQFLDKSGRTVLWRRFNRDDLHKRRFGKLWSEMLPENQRLTVNGVTYVHWYDCITDHVAISAPQ